MKLTKKQLKQIIKEETENAYRDNQQINEFDMPFVGQTARMKRATQKIIDSGGVNVPPELKKLAPYTGDDEWAEIYAAKEFFNDDQKLQQWLEAGDSPVTAKAIAATYEFEPKAAYDASPMRSHEADWARRDAATEAEAAERAATNAEEREEARLARKKRKEAEARMTPMDKCMARGESESACEEMLARAARERSSYEAANTDIGGGAYGEDEEHNKYFAESTRRKNSKMKITKSQLKRIIEEELKRLLRNK